MKTKKLTMAAMLVVMAFILSFTDFMIGSNYQVSVVPLPLIFSGFILGPIYGLAVGLVEDTLKAFTKGYTPFTLFTLGQMSYGFVAGCFWLLLRKYKDSKKVYIISSLAIFLSLAISSVINTSGVAIMFGLGNAAYLALPFKIAMDVIYTIIFTALTMTLYKSKRLGKFYDNGAKLN